MDLAFNVVPVKHEAEASGAFPVCFNVIVLFQYAYEMLNIILLTYFTPKSLTMSVKLMGRQS
jgi:hypothetical protein